MSPIHQKTGLGTILLSLFVCGGMLVFFAPALRAEVFVDDSPKKKRGPTAVASDREPVPAEEVAREVLRMQQQMGGSVVRNRTGLQGWNPPGPVTPGEAPAWTTNSPLIEFKSATNGPINKVRELREAAWQLETTAHRLEKLDLYEQSDALRIVADRLRRDARKMKQSSQSSAMGLRKPTGAGTNPDGDTDIAGS